MRRGRKQSCSVSSCIATQSLYSRCNGISLLSVTRQTIFWHCSQKRASLLKPSLISAISSQTALHLFFEWQLRIMCWMFSLFISPVICMEVNLSSLSISVVQKSCFVSNLACKARPPTYKPYSAINTESAALGSRDCQKQRVGLSLHFVAKVPQQKQRK